MTEIADFGLIVLSVSATLFVALLGMRIADRVSLPYAALVPRRSRRSLGDVPRDRVHLYRQPEDAAALGRIFAGLRA